MALELRQQLKLTQQLVMTPQLQQAIKLLQLSRLELLETVQNELLENPFLDEDAAEPALEDDGARETETPQDADRTGSEEDLIRSADWEDYLGDFASTGRQTQLRETEIPEEMMSFEARLSSKPSLEGHLSWQLRLSDFTPEEVAIGEAVIGNLDSAGYLAATVEDIVEQVGVSEETVLPMLARIQRLDPVGVAARTPQECLLVQLELSGNDDPVLREMIASHLEDLEKKRYKPLARKFKIGLEKIKEYLEIIQKFDPMPGASFGSGEPQYVSPDVFVYQYADEFVIMLNDEGVPSLHLTTCYMDGFQANNQKDKDYLQEKMRSAAWLIKSLYQRQRTLYKVTESIVKYQVEFFQNGVTQLKPLILKDIADDIEMHESTVSRITTNKYVATPHGVYELKFFFNSALELDDGSQVGSESVKALIKKLISEENPKKPLSDERIAEILKDTLQVNIARRTVAKYRTALNICSSSKRKEIL